MSPRAKLACGVLVLASCAGAAWHFRAQDHLGTVLARIDGLGPLGWVAFTALYMAASVLLVPGSVLTLGGAAAFGFAKGFFVIWIASTLGAVAAFLSGRYIARDFVARKAAADRRFAAIDEAVAARGGRIVLLTRLCPVFPFVLLNYLFGATKIPLRSYALATWAGMVPGTALFTYIGSLAGGVARGEGAPATPREWAIRAGGLVATVLVTVYLARVARRALAEAAPGASGTTTAP